MVVSGTSTSVSGTSVDGAGVEAGSGTSTSVSGTSVDGAGVEAGSGSSSNSLSMSSSSSSSSSFLRTASRFLPISVSLHRGILIFGASILSALRLMCPIVGERSRPFCDAVDCLNEPVDQVDHLVDRVLGPLHDVRPQAIHEVEDPLPTHSIRWRSRPTRRLLPR